MYSIKQFLKSKAFIFSFLIMLILTCVNIKQFYDLYRESMLYDPTLLDAVSSFSFWNFVRSYGLGPIIMFVSPMIITLTSLYSFNEKVTSSIFKQELIRAPYNKKMFVELIKSYFKGMCVILFISLIVFLFGTIFLQNNLVKFEYSEYITNFYKEAYSFPYLFIFLYQILICFFCMFIVNLGLITMYFVKKISLTIVTTFIFLNIINFGFGNIFLLVAKLIGSEGLYAYFINWNVFGGYLIQKSIGQAFIDTGILFIISLICVILLYKSKEKVVLNFE